MPRCDNQTLLLAGKTSADGKWMPDARLLATVKAVSKGAAVDVSIRDRAGQKVMREIRPTPAETK